MKRGLQRRLTLVMFTLTVIGTLLAGVLATQLLIHHHQRSIGQQLQATGTHLISLGLSDFSQIKDQEDLNQFIQDALGLERIGKVIQIFDSRGNLIYSTTGFEEDFLPNRIDLKGNRVQRGVVKGKINRYESLVLPYQTKKIKRPLFLQILMPLPRYGQIFSEFWWQALIIFTCLLIVSWLLAKWLTGRLLQPVQKMALEVDRWVPSKIDSWEPIRLEGGGAYLESIARGLNTLSRRTQEEMGRLKKMSRYVAHEMRNPLAILQGEAETVLLKKNAQSEDYAQVLKSSLEEVQRLNETVDSVLKLADPTPFETNPQWQQVPLEAFIQERKDRWEKILERPLKLSLSTPGKLEVRSDPQWLDRLLDNLIRNVAKHTPPQTPVEIKIGRHVERIQLLLEDQGPGMSEELISELNQGREGKQMTGVGLHLCQEIIGRLGIGMKFSHGKSGGQRVQLIF